MKVKAKGSLAAKRATKVVPVRSAIPKMAKKSTGRQAVQDKATNWSGYEEARVNSAKQILQYKRTLQRKDVEDSVAEKKKRGKAVAYALNMCMVSLSQIVDYADINVLQQEYDAILNNLNIENIEKDEALLAALKQILDTCHFYILHAKDKEILEKKQAMRLSNVLGNALGGGSFIALFGTPNPFAIAATAATMIGVAAVRYKSERRKASLQNEVDAWELEKSALEQLHNLRRTLFETAWRLMKEYEFPDKYRLTEPQIRVYNEIISDPDPLSRYERLDLIKDNFEAYPLFWYYLGRAALEASELYRPTADRKKVLGCDIDVASRVLELDARRDEDEEYFVEYRKKAAKAFEIFADFEKKGVKNLLREDLIAASAYLDGIEFAKNPADVLSSIEKARTLCGTNCEIIQSCAVRYLWLLETVADGKWRLPKKELEMCRTSAKWCLRFLVNEGVNVELNGKALSRLYKQINDQAGYRLLKSCMESRHPFVYRWMNPWDGKELADDWEKYIRGDGLKRSVAFYLDGRIRIILSEFFMALQSDRANQEYSALKQLKSDNWGSKVENDSAKKTLKFSGVELEDMHKKLWYVDNKDEIARREAGKKARNAEMIGGFIGGMAVGLAASHAAKYLYVRGTRGNAEKKMQGEVLDEVLKQCLCKDVETTRETDVSRSAEKTLFDAIAELVNPAYDRHFYTLWIKRHESGTAISELDAEILALESAVQDFVKAQAEIVVSWAKFALALDKETSNYLLGNVRYITGEEMATPKLLVFISMLEEQAEVLRKAIADSGMMGERFHTPNYYRGDTK